MQKIALSARSRSWLVLVCVGALVGIYLTVWTVYSVTHTQKRFAQLPPGETATVGNLTYRVVDMKQTRTLVSEYEPTEASAGSVFVVVEVEVTATKIDEETVCYALLVGPEGRTWETDTLSFGQRKLPSFCSAAEGFTANKPFRWEQVFQVPEDDADSIYGLGIEPYTGEPMMVISPAR